MAALGWAFKPFSSLYSGLSRPRTLYSTCGLCSVQQLLSLAEGDGQVLHLTAANDTHWKRLPELVTRQLRAQAIHVDDGLIGHQHHQIAQHQATLLRRAARLDIHHQQRRLLCQSSLLRQRLGQRYLLGANAEIAKALWAKSEELVGERFA